MEIAEYIYTVLLKPPPLRRAANATIKLLLPETIKVGRAVLWINPEDPVVSGALTFRVYERDEIKLFRSCLGPNMTLVDVGANVGLYTAIAISEPAFSGTVLAMEPDPESRAYLERAVAGNVPADGRVRVVVSAAAASDRAGFTSFYRNAENKGDNRIYSDPSLTEGEPVRTETLDELCMREAIDSVQLMKIDVQGAEAKVVAGARQLLKRSEDCVLMTEFWPTGLARSGSDARDYLRMLNDIGFALHRLHKGKLVPLADAEALLSRTNGRKYANLVGLKGRFAAHSSIGRR